MQSIEKQQCISLPSSFDIGLDFDLRNKESCAQRPNVHTYKAHLYVAKCMHIYLSAEYTVSILSIVYSIKSTEYSINIMNPKVQNNIVESVLWKNQTNKAIHVLRLLASCQLNCLKINATFSSLSCLFRFLRLLIFSMIF